MAWKQLEFNSVSDLARTSFDMFLKGQESPSGRFIWRGEPEFYPSGIVPRIDRGNFLTGDTPEIRLEKELRWYDTWWENMLPVVLPRDMRNPTRPDGIPELEWLNFASHHGCNCRLVDWSESPWVALYFACSRSFDKPGRMWCFDTQALHDNLAFRWDTLGVPLISPDRPDRDIAKAAFSKGGSRWIVTQYNFRAPLRMASQQGLFTIASRLGEPHNRLLDECLPESAKFLLVIPSAFKIGTLSLLRSMGVHHESLQYPMLDQVAGSIAGPG